MPATLVLDRLLITRTGSTGPVPLEQLIEWIGLAIFIVLAVSAAIILIRNHRGWTGRH
jgi:hypothetical protein